jgi:hypothetical protein
MSEYIAKTNNCRFCTKLIFWKLEEMENRVTGTYTVKRERTSSYCWTDFDLSSVYGRTNWCWRMFPWPAQPCSPAIAEVVARATPDRRRLLVVPLITGAGRTGAPDQLNSEQRGDLSSQPSVSLVAGGARPRGLKILIGIAGRWEKWIEKVETYESWDPPIKEVSASLGPVLRFAKWPNQIFPTATPIGEKGKMLHASDVLDGDWRYATLEYSAPI